MTQPQEIKDGGEEKTPPKNNQGQETEKKKHNFKEGQPLTFVRVRFPGHNKSYPFLIGKRTFSYGQKVVAMSDRGMAVGYINSFPYEKKFQENMLPIKSISKVATDEDIEQQKENYKKEKEAEILCKRLINKHELEMNLTHVEFTQFGKKCVFYFTAPARVDFRGLVKDLVSEIRLRIELRQISVRDRAAAVGGIGACGRQLCCSSFLDRYGHVNLKMAKNQNLTINFSQLNGVCGQIKCCIKYEDEVYAHKRKTLPQEGSFIICENGDRGYVESLHLLSEQFDMLTEKGIVRRYTVEQYKEKAPKDFKMKRKREFEHVTDERSTVIGLDEHNSEKTRKFEREIERIKSKSKGYSDRVFEELFGASTIEEVKTLAD